MKKIILSGLLLACTLMSFAQEQTVEDLYLRVPAETRIIDSQAQSPSRELKEMAINDLTVMNSEGRLNGNDPFVMRIITNLALEGTGIISTNQGHVVNYYPEVRRKSAMLLGNINTEKSAQSLIEIGEIEIETMVLSEIIKGLSKNTAADPQLVVNGVARLMEQNGRKRDHVFAMSFLEAVENLVNNNIEIENESIFILVSQLTLPESGYLKHVSDKANEVLTLMK